MLNFRRLKQDFSPSILKEGQSGFQSGTVESVKIVNLSAQNVHLSCRVQGAYENAYECQIEVDRQESTVIDSDCDCPYKYDCQHLAAVVFYMEEHLDSIIVKYGKETNIEQAPTKANKKEKDTLIETIKTAEYNEVARRDKKHQKELLEEYLGASDVLGSSSFFLPEEQLNVDKAELVVIFDLDQPQEPNRTKKVEFQLALRLPYRSKPLNIPNLKEFLESIQYKEPLYISSKRYYFTLNSFDPESLALLKAMITSAQFPDKKNAEPTPRLAEMELETFGTMIAEVYQLATAAKTIPSVASSDSGEREFREMPRLYHKSIEEPLRFSNARAILQFEIEYLEAPAPKILINPTIRLDDETTTLEGVKLFECSRPGLIFSNRYYGFEDNIRRKHLRDLDLIRSMTIPEPLFGTLVENALPELLRFAEGKNRHFLDQFVTYPHVDPVTAECNISYLNGELEATVQFLYGKIKVPAAKSNIDVDNILQFVTKQGILARNLSEEQKILQDLFQDFIYDPVEGYYIAKTDKKIVEFMTEVIPRNQHRVNFVCPENLLDQFIYDETTFSLDLHESDRIDMYEIDLKVDGHLNGISVSTLWECISSRKAFIELSKTMKTEKKKKGKGSNSTSHKILVLDLDKLAPIIELFDELGLTLLDDHKEQRPLWSLASLQPEDFEKLPVKFKMSKKLLEMQQQMLGARDVKVRDVPKIIKAELRTYQKEGANWLERLRQMHLNGILADDMGLGKTLQAIIVITQYQIDNPKSVSLIICPTSLVYNWKEEFHKFNPQLKTLIVDGTPTQRKKLIEQINDYDVIITSYSLLQKDIESYGSTVFGYVILDEAQHIKNRGTRNAKSVKQVQAQHRLILTGTPIENSLDELWSLFDFLMPGLLSTYDRFVEKYIRSPSQEKGNNLENLKRKVSPFILRRMKSDVLQDLPPVSEIVYHCSLSDTQRDLYRSYAESARKELSQLVQKEGFDKVQIHVLATLTRLKQICCHPAIFAKETAEPGDSAKYDMLMELLQTLIEGKHKTVIFSQYTRMLQIMSKDLKKQGIPFEYLDGSTKNRLDIVKRFNEDEQIPVFLVSLKAGGTGFNVVGADTVIHYDPWWNPAIEKQGTDRVHRFGQKKNVSSYKLVTLNTIEEKIIELQDRKRGLVTKVISTDEEVISKLTWEEVLELLQT